MSLTWLWGIFNSVQLRDLCEKPIPFGREDAANCSTKSIRSQKQKEEPSADPERFVMKTAGRNSVRIMRITALTKRAVLRGRHGIVQPHASNRSPSASLRPRQIDNRPPIRIGPHRESVTRPFYHFLTSTSRTRNRATICFHTPKTRRNPPDQPARREPIRRCGQRHQRLVDRPCNLVRDHARGLRLSRSR